MVNTIFRLSNNCFNECNYAVVKGDEVCALCWAENGKLRGFDAYNSRGIVSDFPTNHAQVLGIKVNDKTTELKNVLMTFLGCLIEDDADLDTTMVTKLNIGDLKLDDLNYLNGVYVNKVVRSLCYTLYLKIDNNKFLEIGIDPNFIFSKIVNENLYEFLDKNSELESSNFVRYANWRFLFTEIIQGLFDDVRLY